MIAADDRKTWTSTATPVAARLRLRPDTSVRSILDGAWWPRSREPVTEVTALITALDLRYPPLTHVMLNAQAWNSHPRRIQVAGRVVRVGWFASLDACLLIASSRDDQRVDLLVVSPDAPDAVAEAAMGMATDGTPNLRATAIMTAVATHPGQSRAEAAWESEGGGLAGHRQGSPSEVPRPARPGPPERVPTMAVAPSPPALARQG